MRWPLRLQILVPFTVLICSAVALLTVIHVRLASRRVIAETGERLRGIASVVDGANFPLNAVVLRRMHDLSGAHFLVTGENGEVLAASRAELAMEQVRLDDAGARTDELIGPILFADDRYFYLNVPAMNRAGRTGAATLHVLYPEHFYRQARWAAVYPSIAIGGGVLIAAVALSVWTANRLSRPLQSICTSVHCLTKADFRTLPIPARNDEVRDVVRSINHLAAEMDAMRKAIQDGERMALLGQVSAGMIHSLRNDITGARIAVQLHQRDCRDADQESLHVALRQLTLTEEHLKRFLSAGKVNDVRRVNTNLNALLQEIMALLAPTFRHRRINVVTRFEALEAVDVDFEQLRQATIALLMNAMDATGTNGEIEVRLKHSDGAACISIIDNGGGLAPDNAERVFQPFVTTKPEGIGLGLTAARRTAEAHGGTLSYRRSRERTEFELRLPIDYSNRTAPKEQMV